MSLAGEENRPPEDRGAAGGGVARGEPAPTGLNEGAPTGAPGYLGAQGVAGDESTPHNAPPPEGGPHAAADRVEGASSALPTRRAHFRDRPRDWWLRALLGTHTDGADDRGGEVRRSAATDEPAAAGRPEAGTMADASAAAPAEPAGAAIQTGGQRVRREPATPRRPARARGGASTMRARQLRGLIAAIVGLFLLGLAVSHLFAPSPKGTATAPPTAAPPAATSAPAGPLTPIEMPAVKPLAVLGSAAKLNLPREAVTLPDGHVVVADTGNSRLVILDAAGHVLRVVQRGAEPFQQPFAVATMGTGFVVLDSARGSLDLLNAGGGFVRELMHSQQLSDARGLAVGPHDQLYVANPRSNSVLVLSPQGAVVHTFAGPLSAAPGGFNQPSDVAVGGNGTIYVLDNVNDRIEALTPTRAFVRQWPAPRSDTIFSDHLLPLADGRLVASDPAGALVVYRRGDRTPTRLPLQQGDKSSTRVEPVGLALGPHGTLLVTDAQGGTVLLVPLSDLSH